MITGPASKIYEIRDILSCRADVRLFRSGASGGRALPGPGNRFGRVSRECVWSSLAAHPKGYHSQRQGARSFMGWDRNTAERGRELASPLVGAGGGMTVHCG
jgi:hypothetical protein